MAIKNFQRQTNDQACGDIDNQRPVGKADSKPVAHACTNHIASNRAQSAAQGDEKILLQISIAPVSRITSNPTFFQTCPLNRSVGRGIGTPKVLPTILRPRNWLKPQSHTGW